jgi:hypothetical protein
MYVDFLIFGITIGLGSAIFGLILAGIFWFMMRDYENYWSTTFYDAKNYRQGLQEDYPYLYDEISDNFSSYSANFTNLHSIICTEEFQKLKYEDAHELLQELDNLNRLLVLNNKVHNKSKFYSNAALVCVGFSLFSFLTFFLYGV